MYQSLVEGREVPWALLVKDMPKEKHQGPRLHRRAARLGSERRSALQGQPLPRADRRSATPRKEGYVDRWIVYGKVDGEQLFTAKELTVEPGAEMHDQGQRRLRHHLRARRRQDQQAATEQPEDDPLRRADRGRSLHHRSRRQGRRDVREHLAPSRWSACATSAPRRTPMPRRSSMPGM